MRPTNLIRQQPTTILSQSSTAASAAPPPPGRNIRRAAPTAQLGRAVCPRARGCLRTRRPLIITKSESIMPRNRGRKWHARTLLALAVNIVQAALQAAEVLRRHALQLPLDADELVIQHLDRRRHRRRRRRKPLEDGVAFRQLVRTFCLADCSRRSKRVSQYRQDERVTSHLGCASWRGRRGRCLQQRCRQTEPRRSRPGAA